MLDRTKKWEERRKLLASRAPALRIDTCLVTKDKKYGYRIEIVGLGMNPGISPPKITVGGEQVREAQYEPGGRRVTGYLSDPPADDIVEVDLGYGRATGRADVR